MSETTGTTGELLFCELLPGEPGGEDRGESGGELLDILLYLYLIKTKEYILRKKFV
jgi:hypothetical protein